MSTIIGGTTTFGYEQDNGEIHYSISRDLLLDEIQPYLIKRESPLNIASPVIAFSLNDYFSKERIQRDHSIWRILYTLSGKIICRKNSISGEFNFIR
jgi:hypothetical protein